MGDPTVVLGGGADVEVGTERTGDVLAHEVAERLPGHPLDDLALEVALGDGVVARRRARFPPRGLRAEQGSGPATVVEVLVADGLLPARQAGGVAHHVTDLDRVLAVGGELRPHVGHRGVEVELAAVGEHQAGPGRTPSSSSTRR